MSVTTFARLYGIAFLLIGLSGFVPGISPAHDHPGLAVQTGSAMALSLFPVNLLHNLFHLVFGVWGLIAARSVGAARAYGRAVAVIYGLLAIMGLIPVADTTFGLVPIYGNDVWLHALLAAVAGYFGFVRRGPAAEESRRRA